MATTRLEFLRSATALLMGAILRPFSPRPAPPLDMQNGTPVTAAHMDAIADQFATTPARFTAPKTGRYLITGSFVGRHRPPHGQMALELTHYGVTLDKAVAAGPGGDVTVSAVHEFPDDDLSGLELRGYCNSGAGTVVLDTDAVTVLRQD